MSENNNGKDAGDKKLFPYPQCWSDDARMDVLMAPFRLKSVNPENYVSKMKFWQDIIAKYCEHKGSPCFNKREIQMAFARKEKIPYGLDTVLDEMRNESQIRQRAEFMYDPENTWTGWAVNSFVKKPLTWGFRKIKLYNDDAAASMDYILLHLVKKFCNELHTVVLNKHLGKFFHYDAIKTIIQSSMNLNEEGIQICLHTLHCQRKIGLENKEENGEMQIHLVKIPGKSDANIEITATDRAIHNLEITQSNLVNQLDDMEIDIKANDDKARQYLKEGKRQLAKTYLRKKHLLEKNHEKRSLALHNVDTLLSNVVEAQNNGEILDAYKIGSQALQKVLNESGLKYDNVDEIISDVRETIENHEEIQGAIGNANLADAASKFDDVELEMELREILGETEPVMPAATVKTTAAATATTTNNNIATQNVQISDEELLAMLDGLEVEVSTPLARDKAESKTKVHD